MFLVCVVGVSIFLSINLASQLTGSIHIYLSLSLLYKMLIACAEKKKKNCRLVGWFLWHIDLCWLFNAKSIFIQMNSSISNISVQHGYTVCQKHFYFKLFILFKQ